jgi:hypothetical protein
MLAGTAIHNEKEFRARLTLWFEFGTSARNLGHGPSSGQIELKRVDEREAVHKLAILSVDINPGVEVDSSVPHVTRYAVTGLQQGCSHDRVCGHFHALRIEQDVSTIS